MGLFAEGDIKGLVVQLLDRLTDRRLIDFGDMASYLLKTINLLMLRLLQVAAQNPQPCPSSVPAITRPMRLPAPARAIP